jgi:phosphatidylinositol alpha-mannosyltransferase
MKIGIVCPYNIFKGGGVQECVQALASGLRRHGHTVRIITPQPRNHTGIKKSGVIFIGGGSDVKSLHTTAQISMSVNSDALQEVLDREQFDILHFHEPWVPMVSRQILTRSNTVNLATFHAKLPETMIRRTIERVINPYTRSIIKYLHGFTAVSEAAAEYVRSINHLPVTIIPNGIDLAQFKRAPIKPAGNHILFVGRLERRKGLKYLLNAFALLQQKMPAARLTIAGDGPDRRKLELRAQTLGLNNVEFLGYIPTHEKINLLKSVDLFCSPALYGESFGIVLLEAMATGIPIVAGDNPGYRSVLKERGAISLIKPKDAVQFANRLELLLTDTDLRHLWRRWSLEYVKQFTYDTVVDQYEQLYKDLLKKNR